MSDNPQRRPKAASVGLPTRAFLFTLDQIATMLSIDDGTVRNYYVYFQGRHTGSCPAGKMVARNIAPADVRPDWRITETEFVRWLRHKGFRLYERGWPTT